MSASSPRLLRTLILACLLLTLGTYSAIGQNTPEQQAAMLLASARKAYNEKNFSFAATRFREFIQKHGNHKETNSARYGLALSLVEGEQRNFDQALEQLSHLNTVKDYPDRAFVLYYSGLARRGQGVTSLGQALAKPNEAAQHRATARERFTEAAKQFGSAIPVFEERAKEAKIPEKGLPLDLEWAVRSRCDQAEMLLRVNDAKKAREAVAVLTEKKYRDSRFGALGLYYHGFACFLLGETTEAGKSLAQDVVLADEVFGTHARYLVGRVYHLNTKQNEREEARTQYQAVLKDHEAAKKKAQTTLQQQQAQLRNDPERKARLERLVKGPVPDHVARSMFFLGVLQYEDGRFADAADHFKSYTKDYADSSLAVEAKLRQGFCEVQLKQNDPAIKTLTPIAEKEAALADQALLWIAKAHVNKADPQKPETFKTALETFKKASSKANERINQNDPDAKTRRGEILAEQAEIEIAARLPKDAMATYRDILQSKLLPSREDEMTLNLATACQLAGDYSESDKVCAQFVDKHKESTLLPSVLFRRAENAAFSALAAEKLTGQDRTRETTKHNDESIKRYEALIEKYPEHAQVNLARQGLGMAHYRKGDLEKAQKALESIPAGDRGGELAIASYHLADVYLRLTPTRAEDAVAAGKMEEKLKGAADALESFIGAAAMHPSVPDALLKLGYSQQRMARLLAQPAEQAKMLAAARATYLTLTQKHAKHDLVPQAILESAKVRAMQKDVNGAMTELKRFSTDATLKKTSVAPMALLHLATLQRGQNRPADAVATLAECRKDHENALNGDTARSGWVLLLKYHHAVALREAGKFDESRTLFDSVAKSSNDRAEAWDAFLRAGQSQKEGGEKKIADAQKKLLDTNLKGEKRTAEEKNLADGMQEIRAAAQYLSTQEQALKTRKVADEELGKTMARTRARMMYESAWAWRSVAALEQESARHKIRLDRWQKRRDEVAKATPVGQNPPPVAMPEVDLREVPIQTGETEARKQYRALIIAFPDLVINADARFELSELLAQRGDHDEAVKLLQGALEGEKEPSADLADRLKVRLATSLLDRGVRKQIDGKKKLAQKDLKADDKKAAEKQVAEGQKDIESALEQVQTVTGNDKSAMLAHASYREAECLLHLGKTEDAQKLLTKFRDHGPFTNVAGLTDRALLRLGQMLGEKKQWDLSRQAYERVFNFGGSPWQHEARYGIGWARQNQGQYDEAVNQFSSVTNALSTELAARAQLNIGLCRLMQKRYADASTALLVVPFTYDYPELSALALLEASRALTENKQSAQAVKLLRRVMKDHAGTAHAEAAKKRLTDLGEEG